jgi:hypothetical protein
MKGAEAAQDERGEVELEEAGDGRAGASEEELARARVAYRGSQESAKAWRAFTPNPRHHDITYWSMLTSLFVEPGLNRMTLIERIMEQAGVSRSTAERAIREGRESGYLVDRPAGKEVRYFLSDRTFGHCLEFFRRWMDISRVVERFGYDVRK